MEFEFPSGKRPPQGSMRIPGRESEFPDGNLDGRQGRIIIENAVLLVSQVGKQKRDKKNRTPEQRQLEEQRRKAKRHELKRLAILVGFATTCCSYCGFKVRGAFEIQVLACFVFFKLT